jgi:hypothetical protein
MASSCRLVGTAAGRGLEERGGFEDVNRGRDVRLDESALGRAWSRAPPPALFDLRVGRRAFGEFLFGQNNQTSSMDSGDCVSLSIRAAAGRGLEERSGFEDVHGCGNFGFDEPLPRDFGFGKLAVGDARVRRLRRGDRGLMLGAQRRVPPYGEGE